MSNTSDFKISKTGVLTKYQGKDRDVLIPTSVTEIGYAAFYNNYYVKHVQLPDGIRKIGAQAFEDCQNLESIILPDGLTYIGHSAFCGCVALKSIAIPQSVTDIEHQAFAKCGNLADISLPTGIEHIGTDAMYNGMNLVDNRGFLIINSYLLKYRGNNSHAAIPDGVTMICDGAFFSSPNDKIEHITIPATVTRIGADAFRSCKNLKEITLPAGVTAVESGTFVGCPELERVDIPASVTLVKADAFDADAQKLKIDIADISVLPAKLRVYAAVCFAEDGKERPDSCREGFLKYIKANAEKLVDAAFAHPMLLQLICRERMIAPKSLQKFMDAAQKYGNAELTALLLEYGATKITAKQKETADKQKEKRSDCVVERKAVRQSCDGIEGLQFAVTGDLNTFENRKALKCFIESKGGKLVSSVSAKVDYLISNDPQTESEKKKTAEEMEIEIVTEYQFNDLAGRQFVVDESGTLISYAGAAEKVTVPDNVIGIETEAFFNHNLIVEIRLPKSLRFINSLAFCDCENLKSIFISSKELEMDIAIISGCPVATIHAPAGSYAESYAKENNIPFVAE